MARNFIEECITDSYRALNFAQAILKERKSDDKRNYEVAAFKLHQSIEMSLKAALLGYGFSVRELSDNIDRCLSSVEHKIPGLLEDDVDEYLSFNADRIMSWVNGSSYDGDVVTMIEELTEVCSYAERLYRSVVEYVGIGEPVGTDSKLYQLKF